MDFDRESIEGESVPKIVYTGGERARIEAILSELDPAIHPYLFRFKADLGRDEWTFVCHYARAEMRAALELGILARSIADVARQRGASNERGVANLLESVSWMRNFGVTDRADERFKAIAGVESPLFVAIDGLLQLAQDRLFNTLDDEYARLIDATTD